MRDFAFVASPFPVMVTLEDHLTNALQAMAAKVNSTPLHSTPIRALGFPLGLGLWESRVTVWGFSESGSAILTVRVSLFGTLIRASINSLGFGVSAKSLGFRVLAFEYREYASEFRSLPLLGVLRLISQLRFKFFWSYGLVLSDLELMCGLGLLD